MAYNILIVDDSSTVRAILKKTLNLTELEIGDIFEAANGAEALDCLRDNWIDLVMSDLNMPVMTGMELINEMARDGMMKDLPVIVVSTDGSSTRIEELMQKGVKHYIRKPFTPETVGEAINKALEAVNERSKT